MRKFSCLLIIILTLPNIAQSQNSYNTVLKEIESLDTVFWFGLDFSNAKFVGPFPNRDDIKSSYLEAWNSYIINYNLLFYYKINPFVYDLSVIKKRNKAIIEDDLFSMLDQSLTKDSIQKIINEYNPLIKKGKGLVLIVEGFNKNLEQASIWFTYFDIQTRRIIYTEKILGIAKGTTMVNHWAQAIDDVIRHNNGTIPTERKPSSVFGFILALGLVIGIMIYGLSG